MSEQLNKILQEKLNTDISISRIYEDMRTNGYYEKASELREYDRILLVTLNEQSSNLGKQITNLVEKSKFPS